MQWRLKYVKAKRKFVKNNTKIQKTGGRGWTLLRQLQLRKLMNNVDKALDFD